MTLRKKPTRSSDALDDPAVRRAMARDSHSLFFDLYYFDNRTKETAPFQYEMFAISEDEGIRLAAIAGFRESAKTTIMAESLALWAVTGKLQKKFILILSQNIQKAQHILLNIRDKLERSKLLREDLGPFKQEPNQWNLDTIVIPKFDARIMIGSVGQSLRGFKHNQHRPDLIILDDVEDIESVKTKEGRDRPWDWFLREVKPGGTDTTKIIILGNMLHEDSFMRRIERKIVSGEMDGLYREYSFLDKDGNALWKERFPDQESIEHKRKDVGDELVWQTEYLLKLVDREDQIFKREWFKTYIDLPRENFHSRYLIGVDLAISKKDAADYTAMVAAYVTGYGADLRIYILPYPVNKKLSAMEAKDEAENLSRSLRHAKIYVEDVGYQGSSVEYLRNDNFDAYGVGVHGQDKAARLRSISFMVQNGHTFFPEKGAEELIDQLVGFGVERHDDLADAFWVVISQILEKDYRPNAVPIRTSVDPNDPDLRILDSRAKEIELEKRRRNAAFFKL